MQRLCKPNAERQACLIVMLRCRQSYAKIVQIERRTTSLLDRYAEVQLILCKNTFFSSHRQTSWIILMQIAQTVPQIINLPQIPRICTDYFPCGGTRIYFEHEICRRPTDQREVISQISRIHNIHPRNFDGSKLLPQQQKICENPCNLWETLS